MIAKKISLTHAKENKLFYFVANVVVYRKEDGRCLILKRSDQEVVHPGKWGVIGGKMEWSDLPVDKPDWINGEVLDYNDSIEKLLAREAIEEAGIQIDSSFHYLHSKSFIRPDEVPVVMIKFASFYKGGNILLEKNAFSDYAWVNEIEIDKYQCIDGIAEEIKTTITVMKEK